MVFKLKAMPPEGDFSWTKDKYHWTYSGWLDLTIILATIEGATNVPILGYSLVHEEGEEPDEDGNLDVNAIAYRHTHFAVIFKKRLQLRGAYKFDVYVDHPDGVSCHHPHVAARVTTQHMEELFTQYHRGRKYNIKTGKTQFKPPIHHECKLPQGYDFSEAVLTDILEAKDLNDAILAGNIRPRTVNDVKTVRDAAAKRPKPFIHQFPRDSFLQLVPFQIWNVLWMYGNSNAGKTKWALNQFDEPFLVKPFNSIGHLEKLKGFDPTFHTGIVFDEANLSFMTREDVIALVDHDEECTLNVRFTAVTLPKGVKKIFCSNYAPHKKLLPADDFGAIDRRIVYLGPITEPTFKTTAPSTILATPMTLQAAPSSGSPPASAPTAALQFSP